ncbi:Mitochondrial distribution and morphology protein 31, mitochondrial precursor [Cladochytrium tenue]|nr:Mitochondrial distribution and morphology protein 31, mitochondrial precursor [Cladochytrium tenue]
MEYIASKIGEYLSNETGFEITFEAAIAPRWRDGAIRLKDVGIVCTDETWLRRLRASRPGKELNEDEVDLNWTYWDVRVESVDVILSLWQWLEGRGLIRECTMTGVRGVVDRRHIIWDPDWVPTRRKPHENDFMMSKFVVEDLLLTILNPSFRPYTISVFNGELPLFRQQWLLYDIMCADSIVGTFDDCLFSIHRAQDPDVQPATQKGEQRKPYWAKMSHMKISGVPIEHMNTGVTGPFGWITSGSVDLDFHLFIPQTTDGRLLELIRDEIEEIKEGAIDKLDGILREIGAVEVTEDGAGILELPAGRERGGYAQSVEDIIRAEGIMSSPTFRRARLASGYGEAAAQTANARSATDLARYPRSPQSRPVPVPPAPDGGPPRVYFHCNVALNDLRASVPLTSPHISYLSNALIRPIVAYMNAHRTKIPLAVEGKLPLVGWR